MRPIIPPIVPIELAAIIVSGGLGVLVAWWLRRYTTLSGRNLYLPAVGALVLVCVCAARDWEPGVLVALPALALFGCAAGRAFKARMADLGAGEELRNHELARRWVWQSGPVRSSGERVYLRGQGELVHARPWPRALPFVSMSAAGNRGPRLALGAGQHVMIFGATGAGKTTTARRLVAARTIEQQAALLVLDQKGDENDVDHLRWIAAAAEVPFVLFDSQDPTTDRWQPLWGTPDQVAARCVEPIQRSEPYYYDLLRRHLDIVCKVLHAADRWPPTVPLVLDAALPGSYPAIVAMADGLDERAAQIARRAHAHETYVTGSRGAGELAGAVYRVEVALALAGRQLVTPRLAADGETVAVRLIEAIRQRAVVVWRTHADTMPDEATALSVLALADLHDAAEHANAPWTLLLDEFGAVIDMAARRALAILQRARSHGGQIIVVTQSAADIEALTQQTGLLASLTDNFAGIVAHRQSAPESRDWLSKLMGTRAIWQSTNATHAHGRHSGRGSSRRVREFRVSADTFSSLPTGHAVIYTPSAGEPVIAIILPASPAPAAPIRIDLTGPCSPCEIAVHPDTILPHITTSPQSNQPDLQQPPEDAGISPDPPDEPGPLEDD